MQHEASTPSESSQGPLSVTLRTREQAAYDVLRQAIIGGRWKPGETLAVSRLAQDLGMSRFPVTNAVKRLAGEGFVRMRPHQEAVVAPLEEAEIREIYLMRAALEALAADEASRRASTAELETLRSINEELGAAANKPTATLADIRALDQAFHMHLRAMTAMPRLATTLENLADQCEYYRICLLDRYQSSTPSAERHLPLIEALANHNRVESADFMKVHILEGMHLILEALSRDPNE